MAAISVVRTVSATGRIAAESPSPGSRSFVHLSSTHPAARQARDGRCKSALEPAFLASCSLTRYRNIRWRVAASSGEDLSAVQQGVPSVKPEVPAATATSTTDVSSTSEGTPPAPSGETPRKPPGNRVLAAVSVATAVALFLGTRNAGAGPSLRQLASEAVPYDVAVANGRPTVVEFYADWCEVCREMAGDIYNVEQSYRDKVNFVMLNIDNAKWAAELDEFGVEGIPHFAFLDVRGDEEGSIVGKLPRRILEANVAALARGEGAVPYARVVGEFSSASGRKAPPVVDGPRSHGAM